MLAHLLHFWMVTETHLYQSCSLPIQITLYTQNMNHEVTSYPHLKAFIDLSKPSRQYRLKASALPILIIVNYSQPPTLDPQGNTNTRQGLFRYSL